MYQSFFTNLMRKRFLLLSVLVLFLFNVSLFAREPGVYDFGGFLKDDEVKEISDSLKNIYAEYGKSAVVYITSKNLKNLSRDDFKAFIISKAKQYGVRGLFVFISLNPKMIKVLASKDVKEIYPSSFRKSLEQEMASYFRKKDFKGGIMVIVNALRERLSKAKSAGILQPPASTTAMANKSQAMAKEKKSGSLFGKIILWVVIIFIILFIVQFIRGILQARRANMYPQQPMGGGAGSTQAPYGAPYGYGGYNRGSGFKNLLWGLLGGAVGSYLGHKLYDSFSSYPHYHTAEADTFTPTEEGIGSEQEADFSMGEEEDLGTSWDDGGASDIDTGGMDSFDGGDFGGDDWS